MSARLECVPNASEGRDRRVIDALAAAVRGAGAELVDVHSDVDHHRSVFTFLGPAAVVERAVLELALLAVERIDMTRHQGVHPRVGALDVVPVIPVAGTSMAEAVAVALRLGRRLAEATAVPVFFYGAAARRPDRRELPGVRLGGFEGLGERMTSPSWAPDEGPPRPHPTAGATIVGARGPLIAFNALLDSADVRVARAVAAAVREAAGGLPAVRAIGVPLASRGLAQVAMNLLDHRITPPEAAARRAAEEARGRGVRVLAYELVGCAPADAFPGWPADLAPVLGLEPRHLLPAALFAAEAA